MMRKLKQKYKWCDRDRRFLIIKQDAELAECLLENLGKFPFGWLLQLKILGDRLPLPDEEFKEIKIRIKNPGQQARLDPFNRLNPNYKNMHWIKGELEKIKEI